jgi:hypothetical protein
MPYQKNIRWALFGILVLVSQNSYPWYPEYGSEISGVGSYDTTERQYILIAFNRIDNCESASLWLDGSLYNNSQSGNFNRTIVKLKVDRYQSWALSFDILEIEYWLPRPWVLRQKISTDLLKQLRSGNMLTVSIGKHKYIWSLSGSNLAIKSAYKACVE